MHADVASRDPRDKRWGSYSKLIKAREEHNSTTQGASTPELKPRNNKRTKRVAHIETLGEVESSPHGHINEVHNKSPVLTHINKFISNNPQHLSDEVEDEEVKSYSDFMEEIRGDKEERMKMLPTIPMGKEEFCHVHCDYCGHTMIIHGNHIDYLCEGKLHFVIQAGTVYPHKLEVSSTNSYKIQVAKH
jgi:hypothetical protein